MCTLALALADASARAAAACANRAGGGGPGDGGGCETACSCEAAATAAGAARGGAGAAAGAAAAAAAGGCWFSFCSLPPLAGCWFINISATSRMYAMESWFSFLQAFLTSVTCHGDLSSKMAKARRQTQAMAFDVASFELLPPQAGDVACKPQPSA